MDTILNTNTFDPFKKIDNNNKDIVHIRVQQRNGKKCITIVSGLVDSEMLPLKKLAKKLRKKMNCSAVVINDKENDEKIIQLSGDKRNDVKDYLVKYQIVDDDQIKMHGY